MSISFLILALNFAFSIDVLFNQNVFVSQLIPFTYDEGIVFSIANVIIKEEDDSDYLIGLIRNVDPLNNTMLGVSLTIEMYDKNNHVIDVPESGYSTMAKNFQPAQRSPFKISIDKNTTPDHILYFYRQIEEQECILR